MVPGTGGACTNRAGAQLHTNCKTTCIFGARFRLRAGRARHAAALQARQPVPDAHQAQRQARPRLDRRARGLPRPAGNRLRRLRRQPRDDELPRRQEHTAIPDRVRHEAGTPQLPLHARPDHPRPVRIRHLAPTPVRPHPDHLPVEVVLSTLLNPAPRARGSSPVQQRTDRRRRPRSARAQIILGTDRPTRAVPAPLRARGSSVANRVAGASCQPRSARPRIIRRPRGRARASHRPLPTRADRPVFRTHMAPRNGPAPRGRGSSPACDHAGANPESPLRARADHPPARTAAASCRTPPAPRARESSASALQHPTPAPPRSARARIIP